MTHITIASYKDFEKVLKKKFIFDEGISRSSKVEYPNMWLLSFTPKFFKKLNESELQNFFTKLIESRHHTLIEKNFRTPVTFYAWFDQQALQLRFNFLEGKDVELPFTCMIKIVDSMQPILNDFLSTVNDVLNGTLYFEVYDSSEDDDDDAYEIKNYVLNVYTQILQPNENHQ